MATDPVLSDPLLTSAGSHVTPAARSLNLRLGARLFVAADVEQRREHRDHAGQVVGAHQAR